MIQWIFSEEGLLTIHIENQIGNGGVEALSPETNQIATIREVAPNEALKMLGVHIAENLENDTEYEKITAKANKFATAIQVCPLTKTQVILAVKTIYKPAIEHVLPATTFTERQIQTIHRKVMPRLLSRSGISRNYPRALVFGPTEIGGLGFPHIGYMQLATKVNLIIKNVRANTTLGRTFMIMMEQAQMQAGIQDQILATTQEVKYIESEWISSTQSRLQNIGAKITIEDYWTPKINDKMIMNQFNTIDISINELRKLNCCRLYLRVTSLADICSSDGKTIMQRYKSCTTITASKIRRKSHLGWPYQVNPNETTWKLWREALKKSTNTCGDRLMEPLGQWLTNEDYDKIYDSDTSTILIYDTLQWKRYEAIATGRRYFKKGKCVGNGTPSKVYSPITDMINDSIFTTHQNRAEKINKSIQHTFQNYVAKLAKWQRQLINKGDKRANKTFQNALNMGDTILICSDGGVFLHKGYYGWIATTDSKKTDKPSRKRYRE